MWQKNKVETIFVLNNLQCKQFTFLEHHLNHSVGLAGCSQLDSNCWPHSLENCILHILHITLDNNKWQSDAHNWLKHSLILSLDCSGPAQQFQLMLGKSPINMNKHQDSNQSSDKGSHCTSRAQTIQHPQTLANSWQLRFQPKLQPGIQLSSTTGTNHHSHHGAHSIGPLGLLWNQTVRMHGQCPSHKGWSQETQESNQNQPLLTPLHHPRNRPHKMGQVTHGRWWMDYFSTRHHQNCSCSQPRTPSFSFTRPSRHCQPRHVHHSRQLDQQAHLQRKNKLRTKPWTLQMQK